MRSAIAISLVCFFAGIASSFGFPPQGISESDYGQIKKVVLQILEKYPPDRYYYVGIGRSPTPIISFIQQFSPDLAMNLPLSGFQNVPKRFLQTPEAADFQKFRPLNPKMEKKLFEHFAKFLPQAEALRGKELLIIDFTSTGKSLAGASEYLKEFFARRGSQKLRSLALGAPSLNYSYDIFEVPTRMEQRFFGHDYDSWAQYGEYDLFRDEAPEPGSVRKDYQALGENIKSLMKKDHGLLMKLRALFPKHPLQTELGRAGSCNLTSENMADLLKQILTVAPRPASP